MGPSQVWVFAKPILNPDLTRLILKLPKTLLYIYIYIYTLINPNISFHLIQTNCPLSSPTLTLTHSPLLWPPQPQPSLIHSPFFSPPEPQPSPVNKIQEKSFFIDESSQVLAANKSKLSLSPILHRSANSNHQSDNLLGFFFFFFCVLLVGFLDLLLFLLGLQNFWDLLDFGYGLICWMARK